MTYVSPRVIRYRCKITASIAIRKKCWYIYQLCSADKKPFYIGVTTSPDRRYIDHKNSPIEALRERCRKGFYMEVLEFHTEAKVARQREGVLITQHMRLGLLNGSRQPRSEISTNVQVTVHRAIKFRC